MPLILGIDPGCDLTAFVFLHSNGEEDRIVGFGKMSNVNVLSVLKKNVDRVSEVVIEGIAAYGTVGKSVLDTCIWIGRFIERINMVAPMIKVNIVLRKTIVAHICNNPKANDSAVRLAMFDRYEPGANPKKKSQGKLKGISADCWSALAIASYGLDVRRDKVKPEWATLGFSSKDVKNDPKG